MQIYTKNDSVCRSNAHQVRTRCASGALRKVEVVLALVHVHGDEPVGRSGKGHADRQRRGRQLVRVVTDGGGRIKQHRALHRGQQRRIAAAAATQQLVRKVELDKSGVGDPDRAPRPRGPG